MSIKDLKDELHKPKFIVKSGHELKRGDIIQDRGIILIIQKKSIKSGFWDGRPHYTYFDYNDAYFQSDDYTHSKGIDLE